MKEIAYRLKKDGATASFLHERFVPFNFETDVICDSPELRDELKKAHEVWESRGRLTCVDCEYPEIVFFRLLLNKPIETKRRRLFLTPLVPATKEAAR